MTHHRIVALCFVLFIFANGMATAVNLLMQVNPDNLWKFQKQADKASYVVPIDGRNSSFAARKDKKSTFSRLAALPVRKYTGIVEECINRYCAAEEPLVNLYGFLQTIMGKRLISNGGADKYICQCPGNYLVYGGDKKPAEPASIERSAKYIIELNDYFKNKNTKFLFVQAPGKMPPDVTEVLPCVYNYSNENKNHLLAVLREHHVDTLDLQQSLQTVCVDGKWNDFFYRTDHHWKIETGFLATTFILDSVKETLHLPPERFIFLTDVQNYRKIDSPRSFLGTLGTRTGETYSGLDDLTYYVPKFPTRLSRMYIRTAGSPIRLEGNFEESIVSLPPQKRYRYDKTYLNDNNAYVEIINPQGHGKVLVIMNSFSLAVVPFLSLHTERVVGLDPRFATKPLYEALAKEQFDAVICMASVDESVSLFWSYGTTEE